MASILAFQLSARELSALHVIAVRMGVRVRVVQPEEYGEPIGILAGGGEMTGAEATGERLSSAMLVFAGLGGGQVQAVLKAWRQAKMPQIHCKAILTDTNRAWDAYTLHTELTAEHQAMHAGESVHDKERGIDK